MLALSAMLPARAQQAPGGSRSYGGLRFRCDCCQIGSFETCRHDRAMSAFNGNPEDVAQAESSDFCRAMDILAATQTVIDRGRFIFTTL